MARSKATLDLLVRSTRHFDGGQREAQASTVRLVQVRTFVGAGVGTLLVRAVAVSDSEPGLRYQPTLMFSEVSWSEHPDPDHTVQVLDARTGRVWYMAPLSWRHQPVSVRGTCPDFVHTWAWPLHQRLQALWLGRPRPYQRKTTTRPPRNPEEVPGMCKHLLALVHVLAQWGWFTT